MAVVRSPANGPVSAKQSRTNEPASTDVASSPGSESKPWMPQIEMRWVVVVLITSITALVLLLGLPLAAVWIASNSGCCMASGAEYAITFWASMIAGFLTLFGLVLTAVFVITAFRTEQTAQVEAHRTAEESTRTYLKRHKKKLLKEMEVARDCVTACSDSIVKQIQKRHTEARDKIDEAENRTNDAANEAQAAIAGVRDATAKAVREAEDAIVAERNQTTKTANEAQAAISEAGQAVERGREEAMRTIDDARQEAEAAARAVRERADRATGGPAPTEEGPERPDE